MNIKIGLSMLLVALASSMTVHAQSDIELLRKSLEFYIKNSDTLSASEEAKASLLFHRLGRMEIK